MKNWNIKKISLWLAVIMICCFTLAAAIFFQSGGYDIIIKGTNNHSLNESAAFNMSDVKEIRVNCGSEDVKILPTDGDQINVRLLGSLYTKSNKRLPKLDARLEGNQLAVKVVNSSTINIGFNFSFYRDLYVEIDVPKAYNSDVVIHTTSGDIKASDCNLNSLSCQASSGELSIRNIQSKDCTLKASSGDITARNISADRVNIRTYSGELDGDTFNTGNTELSATSGDLKVRNMTGNLKASSSSGEIRIDYSTFQNNVDLRATSGDVRLRLPENSEFALNAHASSGDISTNFPITISGERSEHSLNGTVTSDNNKITVRTSSGDIQVNK